MLLTMGYGLWLWRIRGVTGTKYRSSTHARAYSLKGSERL